MEKEICGGEKGNLGEEKVLGGDRQARAHFRSNNHPEAVHHDKANYQHHHHHKEYNKEVNYKENNHHKTYNHKEANNHNTKAGHHNASGIPSSYCYCSADPCA